MFNKVFDLYANVFEQYPLAAAITTLLFVVVYALWKKYNNDERVRPDGFWEAPEFWCVIGWLILTPLLGFFIEVISTVKEALSVFLGIYVTVFKTYPAGGAIVTIALFVVYAVWRQVLRWQRRNFKTVRSWFWKNPEVVLVVAWLILAPIAGLALQREGQPNEASPSGASVNSKPAPSQQTGSSTAVAPANKPEATTQR